MCSTYDVTGDLELKTPFNPASVPIAGPGAVVVWELTNFGAECSSKDCGSLPAPSSSVFITGIVIDGLAGDSPAERLPTIQQQTITYPLKLAEDADETYLTFAGELVLAALGEKPAGSYVLTGAPAGLSLTGSLAFEVTIDTLDVDADFLNATIAGDLVVCGL